MMKGICVNHHCPRFEYSVDPAKEGDLCSECGQLLCHESGRSFADFLAQADRVDVEYSVTISVSVDNPAPTCDDLRRAIYLGTGYAVDSEDAVIVTSEASAL